jgi:hypothetical protein
LLSEQRASVFFEIAKAAWAKEYEADRAREASKKK